ncbi:MAG: hypothetical protein ACAI38_25995 [Myxococcota bacterium]|nr:hypothetical protein [Myxococcota bacterium]
MLGYAYDEPGLSLVAMLLGRAEQVDYAKLVSVIHEFGDLAQRRTDRDAHVLMYVGNSGPPSNNHRRAIAGGADRFSRMRFAFVSESTIARGVNMAIQLLAPARAGVVRSTHASIDDALMWFESELSGSGVLLRSLVERARAGKAP